MQRFINLKAGAAAIGLMLFVYSCKHDLPLTPLVDPNQPPVMTGLPCSPDSVYFSQQVLPILLDYCATSGCHDEAGAENGVILSSYAHVMNTAGVIPFQPEESDIYHVLITNGINQMPLRPLPRLAEEHVEKIRLWIAQGAKNEICETGIQNCDTTAISYAADIFPILNAFCTSCHSGPAGSYGIDMFVFAEVEALAENGSLEGAIRHEVGYYPMPQGGTLPTCEIELISAWVAAGAPNN